MYRKVSESELMEAIISSRSRAEVLKKIGLVPRGGNYATINNLIKKYNIDTSHMTGQGWNKGMKQEGVSKRAIPMAEVLIKDSTFTSSNHLRKRLLKEGIKEHRCDKCLRQTWNDIPIALELHHVNGDKQDHRIENINLLCPNCHSQTKTYRGKNIKNGNSIMAREPQLSLNFAPKRVGVLVTRERKAPLIGECPVCSKEFLKKRSRTKFCSPACSQKHQQKFEVSREDLERLVWEKPITVISKLFGVCDHSVLDRCSKYGISKPPSGYWIRKV